MWKICFSALLLIATCLMPVQASTKTRTFPGSPAPWLVKFQSLHDQELWSYFITLSADDAAEDPVLRKKISMLSLHFGKDNADVPLYLYAALQNDVSMIKHLHDAGIDLDARPAASFGAYSTLSAIAFLYGENGNTWEGIVVDIRPDTFMAILNSVDLGEIDASDQYALFDIALMHDDVQLASSLLSQGFPVNWRDEFGSTLLIHALWAQAYAVAELLLERGADPFLQRNRSIANDASAEEIIATALQHLPDGEDGESHKTALLRLQQKLLASKLAAGTGLF